MKLTHEQIRLRRKQALLDATELMSGNDYSGLRDYAKKLGLVAPAIRSAASISVSLAGAGAKPRKLVA
jgi:hypothetical protein